MHTAASIRIVIVIPEDKGPRSNGPLDRLHRYSSESYAGCTHDVEPRPFARCQRLQYGIQYAIELFADILCKKSQNEIAVLLQQAVFPAIASVGFRIGEMLRAIEFHNDTQRLVEEIDFHLTLPIERNWHANIQLKTAFCLGKSFKASI